MLLLTAPDTPLSLPKGNNLPPIIPVRWRGNPNARIIERRARVVKIVLKEPNMPQQQLLVPVYDYIQSGDKMKKIVKGWAEIIPNDDRADFTHRTVFGRGMSEKCRMCGGRATCSLGEFKDLCSAPLPVPKGAVIIDGCAIFIHRSSPKAGKAPVFKNKRPIKASAIDIDDTGKNVIMKVKVLKLWDTRSDKVAQMGLVGDETGNIKFTIWKKSYQPPMREGRCYHIHNAVTDFFGGSYQIQATEKTTITELKRETVRTKTEFIRSPALSMLRDDVDIPETALRVPGIDEPKPTWEDYSSTPFIYHLDDIEFGDEDSDVPPDIDPLDKGFKLKKALNSLYVKNPAKAKEMAAKLTPAQWKSIDRIGGLNKDLAFGICKAWEEPEPEGKLRATEAGFSVITRKEKQSAIDVAQTKRLDKFMINHGFRLKDKLEDLMLRNTDKARAFAARLTLYDWQALDYIGGLNPQKGAPMMARP